MEALRRIVNLDQLKELFDIPSHFNYPKVEILILPLEVQSIEGPKMIERSVHQNRDTGLKASNAQEAFALLEQNPVNTIKMNSTQLLREIRDTE